MFSEAWPDICGQLRTVEIDAFAPIGDLPPHPAHLQQEMTMFDRELLERTADRPNDPATAVDLAVWAHMEAVRIHPFQEGNGKTARLLMNVIIMRHVTGPTLPVDIPIRMRDRYMTAVQEARQGRFEPFADLIADLLERMAEAEERRSTLLPAWRRKIRLWRRG
jgi:Fic family protein